MIRSCWKWLYLQRTINWDEGCRSRKSTIFMVVIKWYAWNHTDIYPGLTTGACILILEPKKGKSIMTISSKNQSGSDEWNPQKLGNYPSGFSKLTESKQTLFIWGFRAPLQAYNSRLHLNFWNFEILPSGKDCDIVPTFPFLCAGQPGLCQPYLHVVDLRATFQTPSGWGQDGPKNEYHSTYVYSTLYHQMTKYIIMLIHNGWHNDGVLWFRRRARSPG